MGHSHTLVIKSQFKDIDESVKYGFRFGRCLVRSVPVPSEKGEFTFVVAHSRYPDLQLTSKVFIEPVSDMEPLTIRQNVNVFSLEESETHLDYRSPPHLTPEIYLDYSSTQHLNPERDLDYRSPQHLTPDIMARGQGTYIKTCVEFEKDLENDIREIHSKIGKLESEIKLLEDEQKATESSLSEFGDIKDQILSIGTHGSVGKNSIIARVESKPDCAAALVMKLLKELPDQDRCGSMGNIMGIVALLGTTHTFELSRLFAEYLGDQMLAVVCKYHKDVRLLETYRKDGKLNPKLALHMFARALGQSINGRFFVLCIEDIRACNVDKDVDGKLLFPDPTLPDGSTPTGFLGYAVNKISIDVDHVDTKTDSGCGLRETLFYRLFGETQVYETRDDMIRAIPCIKDGAVSLDGGILRGNGVVSLGCLEPDIVFPVVPERNLLISQNVLRSYRELKLKLKETIGELVKKRTSHERVEKVEKETRIICQVFYLGPVCQVYGQYCILFGG